MSMLIAALALATAGTAPTPASNDTITVTARRAPAEEVRDFVQALTPRSTPGGLRRFEESVCPIVVGLPANQASAIAERIRHVAASVDVAVGGHGCTPNVIVAVTNDKQRFLAELLRTKPDYFGQLSDGKVRQIMRSPGASAAWQTDGVPLNARGQRLFEDPGLGVYINRTTESAGRIRTPTRMQFETAVVVVERRALDGLTATQLADYAALRALTGAEPSAVANSGAPTILRLLDADANSLVPVTMTTWDYGFLRGYYHATPNLSIASQQSEMRKTLSKDIGIPAPR